MNYQILCDRGEAKDRWLQVSYRMDIFGRKVGFIIIYCSWLPIHHHQDLAFIHHHHMLSSGSCLAKIRCWLWKPFVHVGWENLFVWEKMLITVISRYTCRWHRSLHLPWIGWMVFFWSLVGCRRLSNYIHHYNSLCILDCLLQGFLWFLELRYILFFVYREIHFG